MSLIPKILIVALLVAIFFGVIGYKIYEGKSMKSLEQLYNQVTLEEIMLVEELEKQQLKLDGAAYVDVAAATAERIKNMDDIINLNKISLDMDENYLNKLEQNNKQFEEAKQKGWVLFGSTGKSYRAIVDAQLTYYNYKIIKAKDRITADSYFIVIREVMKDSSLFVSTMKKFENKKGGYDFEGLFREVPFLSKYAESNFKYKDEERIKEMYPYGYEYIIKERDFFKVHYLILRDMYEGDNDSASYKLSRLGTLNAELNTDTERLFSDGDEQNINKIKDVIESTLEKIKIIKEFEKNGVSYPFLGKIAQWEEDLDLCSLYVYKTKLYNSITKKYPEGSNFNDFVKELSTISPKTTDIDNDFSTNYVKFIQDEKNIEFVCIANNPEQAFTFTIIK